MNTYYGVVMTIWDSGKTTMFSMQEDHERIPENTAKSYRDHDTYVDWFSNKKIANDFMEANR